MKLKSAKLLDFGIAERYLKNVPFKSPEFRNAAVFDWNRISIADFGFSRQIDLKAN